MNFLAKQTFPCQIFSSTFFFFLDFFESTFSVFSPSVDFFSDNSIVDFGDKSSDGFGDDVPTSGDIFSVTFSLLSPFLFFFLDFLAAGSSANSVVDFDDASFDAFGETSAAPVDFDFFFDFFSFGFSTSGDSFSVDDFSDKSFILLTFFCRFQSGCRFRS